MQHKNPYRPHDLSVVQFIPNTFCYGADPAFTTITGYLSITSELLDTINKRRPTEQSGDVSALIVAWDLEYETIRIVCIDTNDTQCMIGLNSKEANSICQKITSYTIQQYHHTPEYILNYRRKKAHMPPLHGAVH